MFEFDPNKSRANKEKHGIDFVEAQGIWDDKDRIEAPTRTIDEERYYLIGKIGEKMWAAVITYRGKSIRII